jgi:cytochrome P450
MTSSRKIDRGEGGCPVHRDSDGVWQIQGFAAARALLRSTDTVQAGLGIEYMAKMPSGIRRPVLYRDGPEHREHRRQTARFFTPKRVDGHYRELMNRITEREITLLRRQGRANLAEVSFRVAVDVAKAVVGLTESKPGTDKRLDRFFIDRGIVPGFTSLPRFRAFCQQISWWTAFHVRDVRPAVRVRRRTRRDDLISHLIDEGCTDIEILAECLTFASAGMVTTREFMNVAAWHLFTDDDLRTRFREGDERQRHAVLHEILRLEPPINTLKRRTSCPVDLPDGSHIPTGELVHITSSAANTDPGGVGEAPLRLLPERPVGAALSFGEGPHKCPGMYVAIQETDIFLSSLFALDGVTMASPPVVTYNEAFSSYELRDLIVTVL